MEYNPNNVSHLILDANNRLMTEPKPIYPLRAKQISPLLNYLKCILQMMRTTTQLLDTSPKMDQFYSTNFYHDMIFVCMMSTL